MRDVRIVFNFELRSKLKEKGVRISTIIILAVILLATFVPTFINMFDRNGAKEEGIGSEIVDTDYSESDDVIPYGYVIKDNNFSEEELKSYNPFNIAKKYETEADIRKAVENEELEKAIIINNSTDFKLLANDIPMYDSSLQEITSSLTRINRDMILKEEGIDPLKVDKAESIVVTSEAETLGKSAAANYFFAYIGVFIIYFVIILYGNSVATSVAREKNDRTMELLITNTSSSSLIWGKVLASLIISLGQIILTIGVAWIGVAINQKNYPSMIMDIIKQSVSLDVIGIYLIFALFGFLLYYFLYASVGALVSKVEEVNSAMGPIQFIFVAVFMISMFGLSIPDSTLMKVASLFPFSSPLAMFIRYSMTTVGIGEIILGIIILVITVIAMSYLSIKIYRMGTLNYGNRIGFFKAIRKAFNQEIN